MSLLKVFNTVSSYEAAKEGEVISYPNISFIDEDGSVRYFYNELYEWVDLGLPSGLKWSAWNVGATRPEEYGLYFAWGETQGYTDATDEKQFSWADYKWSADDEGNTMTKYPSDGSSTEGGGAAPVNVIEDDTTTLLTLLPEDDAATATDRGCRMPTFEECFELMGNTTSEWVSDYNGTGVAGRILTSNVNGNSIFVPAAGFCVNGPVFNDGQYGYLWSSSLNSSYVQSAFRLTFSSGNVTPVTYDRCYGLSIRPVKE